MKRKLNWGIWLPVLLIVGAVSAALFWGKSTAGEYAERPEYDFTKEFAKEFWCVQTCLQRYKYESLYVNKGLGGRWGKLTAIRTGAAAGEPLAPCLNEVLLANGWQRATIADAPFLPQLFDAAPGQYEQADLSFTAVSAKQQHLFFNLRIWIAKDEHTAVLYLETGW